MEKTNLQVDELSLQQLDQALEEMDPEFSHSLEAVRQVAAADVQIDTIPEDGELDTTENPTAEDKVPRWKKWLVAQKIILIARFRTARARTIIFFKTTPKELFFWFLATAKRIKIACGKVINAFATLSRIQKASIFTLVVLALTMTVLISANLRGKWLPSLYPPLLTSFTPHADKAFEYNPEKDVISFFRAFPQDPEIFLFPKIKVNLRRSEGHPNPMGGFEIYAQVDSHDTAIELQSRQVEMHDMIQRVFEENTYNDLVSDLGKSRLKGLVKKEIDRTLTQGWVTEIHFKNFILKP